MNGLNDDPCNIKMKEQESQKPMKYYVQNYFDIPGHEYRGVNFHDGFGVPVNVVDPESSLRYVSLVRDNLPQNLPALPLNNVGNHYRGIKNTHAEDILKPVLSRELKQCQPPVDENMAPFYERHFAIFDHLPVRPNQTWKTVVQQSTAYRQGDDTRKARKIRQ